MTDLSCYRCKSQPCKCADGTTLYLGDCRDVLAGLPEKHFHCCVTSPPYYGLRDYQIEGQIGLEKTPDEYVAKMVEVLRAVWRVLRDDGVCWVNIGDSYVSGQGGRQSEAGELPHKQRCEKSSPRTRDDVDVMGWSERAVAPRFLPSRNTGWKPKDLMGMPWRLAFALQADEWYLRDAVVWHKPSPMPGSQRDRCTSAYEFVFQLTKRARYFWDMEAIKELLASDPASWGRHSQKDSGAAAPQSRPMFGEERNGRNGTEWGDGATRVPRNVWTIASEGYPGAHFATMPRALAEKCIKAATSEKGCCPECGAPWGRIVEKERVPTRPGTNTKVMQSFPAGWGQGDEPRDSVRFQTAEEKAKRRSAEEIGNRDPQRHTTETRTVGWKPTCECSETITVPCRILDPFGGAGTTGLAAIGLQRHCMLIELSREYCKLTVQRLREGLYPKRTKREDLPGQKLMEFADGS